jgi:chemotaxis protein methyltransferase WspC
VRAEIRDHVRFQQANLVAPGALAGEPPFDAVLCRNLWVYLTPDARERLETLLVRLLAEGGALFMGHAESPDRARFERVGPASAFMFRVATEGAAESRLPITGAACRPQGGRAPSPRRSRDEPPPRAGAAARPLSPPSGRFTPAPPPAPAAPLDLLAEARRLADAGDLENAAVACVRALGERGHDAEAYALLGTIEHGRGRREEAFRAWQRAVYLDPDHRVALLQLALAWRERGEPGRADALMERAARSGRDK